MLLQALFKYDLCWYGWTWCLSKLKVKPHTSNNWHLFTLEMGWWFNIFNWILICKMICLSGKSRKQRKAYSIGGQYHLSYYTSIMNLNTISLPTQNPTSSQVSLMKRCLKKLGRKFSKLLVKRETCVNEWMGSTVTSLIRARAKPTSTSAPSSSIGTPLVCGWIPTESSSWVSHWLTFLCQEI